MGQNSSCTQGFQRLQLHRAIKEGRLQLVSEILEKDSQIVDKAYFYGRLTPLQLAALTGDLKVLTLLLQNGADPSVRRKGDGKTPLMFASKNGDVLCVERLLRYGANVLAFDSKRRTCLHYACRSGHVECVVKILDAGRNGSISHTWGFTRFVNVRDNEGAIPLHMAARAGQLGIVRLLLNNGALVSATTSKSTYGPRNGITPLHSAARGGSLECIEELLAWGADRTQKDMMGYTPYTLALYRGHFACAAILNPNSAEPMVWPSPVRFMNELEPETRIILEAALAEANGANYRSSVSDQKLSGREKKAATGEKDIEIKVWSSGSATEVCNICVDQECSIELRECGHRMCASCTLALCCHNKPNPDQVPSSPPPSCPFCRSSIGKLIVAKEEKTGLVSRSGSRRGSSRRLWPV